MGAAGVRGLDHTLGFLVAKDLRDFVAFYRRQVTRMRPAPTPARRAALAERRARRLQKMRGGPSRLLARITSQA